MERFMSFMANNNCAEQTPLNTNNGVCLVDEHKLQASGEKTPF
jgi:hypothetical protein